jgi:hypothetical protein
MCLLHAEQTVSSALSQTPESHRVGQFFISIYITVIVVFLLHYVWHDVPVEERI